jgi:hypothetical protein
MPATEFKRDEVAAWYAEQHLSTDPGIATIFYLPSNAGEREIRFVEINHLIGDRNDDALEPIDFGIDMGTDAAHKLFVLDVTPDQWERIQSHELQLPGNWSLENAVHYGQCAAIKSSGGESMIDDPIVEEVRRVRDAYAASFNYDLRAMVRDIQERQKRSGRKYVSYPPVTIAPKPTLPTTTTVPPTAEASTKQ